MTLDKSKEDLGGGGGVGGVAVWCLLVPTSDTARTQQHPHSPRCSASCSVEFMKMFGEGSENSRGSNQPGN